MGCRSIQIIVEVGKRGGTSTDLRAFKERASGCGSRTPQRRRLPSAAACDRGHDQQDRSDKEHDHDGWQARQFREVRQARLVLLRRLAASVEPSLKALLFALKHVVASRVPWSMVLQQRANLYRSRRGRRLCGRQRVGRRLSLDQFARCNLSIKRRAL
jgi:hypothetical protein